MCSRITSAFLAAGSSWVSPPQANRFVSVGADAMPPWKGLGNSSALNPNSTLKRMFDDQSCCQLLTA